MTEPHQYFDPEPAVPSHPSPVELVLPDIRATLQADRGVFARTRVDPGTVALLRASPAPPGEGDLLDLGCGYGPIACVLARRAPGAVVWAVDVNRRALALTRTNAAALDCPNVRAVEPDEVPAEVRFAGVWSNPPIRAGKTVLQELLNRWLPRLGPGASAWLVVHHHLGGDSLASWLRSAGYDVARRASKQGYRILEGDVTVRPLGPTDVKRLHREWNRRTAGRVALLLDGLQSPYNMGAIVRTAAAFRVEQLYLTAGGVSPTHPKAGRLAMGTERYLSWSTFDRGPDAADAARDDGFTVVGLELVDTAVPLHLLSAGPDVCLALGHEDHGLSPATLAACDTVAFIPQLGRVGSLNVATACAIGIYELRRQAWV